MTSVASSIFVPRTVFPRYNITLANFQGHHRVALQRMRAMAGNVDLIIEVRDARAPLSTRNGLFTRVFNSNTPRVVLYSKKDLSPLTQKQVDEWHPQKNALLVNCGLMSDARKVLKVAKGIANSMVPPPPLGIKLLVAGMPNVGKSTFLNNLRTAGTSNRIKAAKTGGLAGVTRGISTEIRVSTNPSVFIYDSPGVFVPYVKDEKAMISLAITGAMRTSIVDPIIQADYLLYRLNRMEKGGHRLYKKYIDHPTNDIEELLRNIWKNELKPKQRGGGLNETGAAAFWVDHWRQGYEGKVMLDDLEQLQEYEKGKNIQERMLDEFSMDFDAESRRWKKTDPFA